MFDDTGVQLPLDIFRLIRELIRNHCGIYFDDKSLFIVQRRLARRLQLHRMKDYREYYHFLLYDKNRDEELQAIMDILTVNETYFFRGETQLTAFSEEILPELRERNKDRRRINIWSAGCATGEEPYTLAMLISERGGFEGWDINILGSDISQKALKTARSGVYRKNSFRSTNPYFIKNYFQEDTGGNYIISNKVKALVNFNHLNLLDLFKVRLVGEMDVVFCRNVLIYFDQAARKKAVENIFSALVDGGYLILGHVESLINISTAFLLKHLKNDMVYQKPFKKTAPGH